MKTLILASLATVGFALGAEANNHSAEVPNLTAAEISAHKIDKLVQLKQVDAAFVKNLKGIEVSKLENGGPAKPTFKVIAHQESDDGKEANKLELTLDSKGKALGKAQIIAGTSATKPTVWGSKDPITLIEEGLHHVEHVAHHDKKVGQYIVPFKAVRISQVTLDNKSVAKLEIVGDGIQEKLNMYLSLTGELLKTERTK